MREQMAKGHAILSMHAEAGKVPRNPIVEAEFLLAYQHHHGDRRSENLSQRREIVDRIDFRLVPLRHERAISEGALKNHLGAAAHDHGCAGKDVSLDGVLERLLYLTPS